MIAPRNRSLVVFGVMLYIASRALAGDTFKIAEQESVFAIVTHKGGIAATLAHNHFIHAAQYTANITIPKNDAAKLAFTMRFKVDALAVDDPAIAAKWYPNLEKLEILKSPFSEVSKEDRAKIKAHMLAPEQLDAKQFGEISGALVSLKQMDTQGSDWIATFELTAHGKTVRRELSATIDTADGKLHVTATGKFKFTEFGIKPFSAALGAVKNQDEFDLFVDFTALAAE